MPFQVLWPLFHCRAVFKRESTRSLEAADFDSLTHCPALTHSSLQNSETLDVFPEILIAHKSQEWDSSQHINLWHNVSTIMKIKLEKVPNHRREIFEKVTRRERLPGYCSCLECARVALRCHHIMKWHPYVIVSTVSIDAMHCSIKGMKNNLLWSSIKFWVWSFLVEVWRRYSCAAKTLEVMWTLLNF